MKKVLSRGKESCIKNNCFPTWGEGGTNIFYTQDGGGDDNIDGQEEDVSKANTLENKTSKLSAGAKIFRGPLGPEILVDKINKLGQRQSQTPFSSAFWSVLYHKTLMVDIQKIWIKKRVG